MDVPVIQTNQLIVKRGKIGGVFFRLTVIDSETGEPLPGVTVQLLNTIGQNILSYDADFSATDSSGELYLSDIPTDQDYVIVLTKPGYKQSGVKVADLLGASDWSLPMIKDTGSSLILPIGIAAGLMLLAGQKKKMGAIETSDIINGAIIVGGGYLILTSMNLIDNLLEFLGLQDSKETKGLDYALSDPNNFWNPNFWQKFSSYTYAINEYQAKQIINQLKSAFGPANDDEAAAISALKSLKTQSNLSFLAWVFQRTDGQDLLTWLRGGFWPYDRLSDADVYSLHNYFSKLPTH